MSEQNIEIKVEEGIKELIIRRGEAEPIVEPKKLSFNGLIQAPGDYFQARKHLMDKDKALVVVSRRNLTITLFKNPEDSYAAMIMGSLLLNKDLKEFQINPESKTFKIDELTQFLRMRRRFFANPEIHSKLIDKLGNFKGSVNKEYERKNDNRGNMKVAIEQTAKTELPNDFILNMPIYEGMENSKFKVEIFYDVRELQIEFWFESTELVELIETKRDEIINNEIKRFEGFCTLEV